MNNGDRDDISIWTRNDVVPCDENWQDLLGIYSGVLQDEVFPLTTLYDMVPANFETGNVENVCSFENCNRNKVPQKVNSLVELIGMGTNLDDPRTKPEGVMILQQEQDFDGYNLQQKQMIPNSRLSVSYRPSYNLNLPARLEDGESSTTARPFQLGPATPEQKKQIKNYQIIQVPHLSIEEISTQESDKQDDVVVLPQQHEFVEKEHNTQENQNFDGEIDLNKTPPQRTPKRRKHRPKVVIEGKPKRTPKPKVTTPDGNQTTKRKYVRKKGIKTSTNQASDAANEVEVFNHDSKAKSCKRALNFDLENGVEKKSKGGEFESRERNNEGSEVSFDLNMDYHTVEWHTELNKQSRSAAKQVHQENLHDFVRNINKEISPQEPFRIEATTPPKTILKDHTLNVIARNLNINHSANHNKHSEVHNCIGQSLAQLVIQANTSKGNLQTMSQRLEDMVDVNEKEESQRECSHTELSQPPMLSQIWSQGVSNTSHYNEESDGLWQNGSESSKTKKVEDKKNFHTQSHGLPYFGNEEKSTIFINIMDEINKVTHYWNTNPTDSIHETASHNVAKFSQENRIVDSPVQVSTKRKTARQTSSKKTSNVTGFQEDTKTTSMIFVDYITNRMKDLRIDDNGKGVADENCSAVIPYAADGAVVPYEAFHPIKKRRARPKVDLDPETNRLWNLLMGKEGIESGEGMDNDKQERWEEERKVFRGRVDSFISQMHLVQELDMKFEFAGDRRFSKWKGSVVDSVIGVFLTQNVSDHLSSSAFLSLAAKFPVKSTNIRETCCWNRGNSSIEHEVLVTFPDGTSYNHRTIKEPAYENSVVTSETFLINNHTRRMDEGIISSQNSSESFMFKAPEDIRSSSGSNSEAEDRIRKDDVTLNFFKQAERITSFQQYLLQDTRSPLISYQQSENAYLYPFTTSVPPSKIETPSNGRKRKAEKEKPEPFNWDMLRKGAESNGGMRGRSMDTMDSLDYEALRNADVREISEAIKERGMNNMLAERIKDFLNRLVRDHGRVDLEWLRNVQPDKVKDYLLSIRGLGLKSVECVRLLTLHHLAFPVDTNVGRIAVRLGWVPLQPLPESLQLHLLELYPVLESIQKYLWPRLCMLDQETLYELHYQMITFGKVFCTKRDPNCNACPLRAQCRHFASAFASARLALPSPKESRIVNSSSSRSSNISPHVNINPLLLPPAESLHQEMESTRNNEPIIEEPTTPDLDVEVLETDIEDAFYDDPDEIPVININIQEFTTTLQNIIQENKEMQESDMSKALVALSPQLASIPVPKLKHVSRLRTEHQVYELPDSHPLLKGLDRREPDDPSPYLLAIWTPGETADSIQPPESKCSSIGGGLCNNETCFSCNSTREAQAQTVRGTILIPCRTATRGSFPLNGTYFQVNEVFADHETSMNPMNVPRGLIWNLPRRKVFFGTSVSTIFKGFVCVRGFDQKTRAPRPLMARLHLPASKMAKKNE
ncbi:DNA-(apurinic or apyrimidinic site) lyase [Handroanthus impetiginosus]|uniref:DNA-(Apurinic or apyrimidinic site) lyase n=1 Tax=Handroanthus impetiginosus TaxID=429701 RepID=A0A2G9GJL4_9LAMI|nr:DNA-(apurinic or apyrimidinic site) lyase [Handroanthus impetiginosus]